MKKFISMVMAAAMVVSLVPATAFAANESTFKVVGDLEITEKTAEERFEDEDNTQTLLASENVQLQIKVKDIDTKVGDPTDDYEIKLKFDNAEVHGDFGATDYTGAKVIRTEGAQGDKKDLVATNLVDVKLDAAKEDDSSMTVTIKEVNDDLEEGDIIVLPLSWLDLTKTSKGTVATVKVTGELGDSDEMPFISVLEEGISVELDDEVADVAVEEVADLDDIVIENVVGDNFAEVGDKDDKMTLKLSKGFEFANNFADDTFTVIYKLDGKVVADYTCTKAYTVIDENEIEIEPMGDNYLKADEMVITGLKIEAVDAKEGDVATLTVKVGDADSQKVEVATVCDFKVVMSVDEDEDVPVFYSGVSVNNDGLTVDDDHKALEVTLKETFAGAWSMHKDFTLGLPEGVYVTAVEADDENGTFGATLEGENGAFWNAYQEGDHNDFVFEKRVFNETDPDSKVNDKEHEMTFVLTLVADPGFVGDVVLTLEGDAVDTQEVTIAKFVSPIAVSAEQNDLKIDYRYTEVGTDIVVTEAEAGLWDKDLVIGLAVERGDMIQFEDDATFTVNEGSDMEIDDKTDEMYVDDEYVSVLQFTVEEESDEEAAVVTISDMELFMQRNIPAGPYDLELYYNVDKCGEGLFINDVKLFAPDEDCTLKGHDDDKECYVADIEDYSTTVKEAWINVVTAGREADDASFTTKVVVPVGEAYIIAGETQVALDVPAYVNAAGYTMLPVRAVAVALGINTQNVLWDQATKTVTILYGQRIITMQVGAKVVYVNGSAIPASASVEIVDGRTFLPMRDLATALGVTDITWDAATKTATLNGNA